MQKMTDKENIAYLRGAEDCGSWTTEPADMDCCPYRRENTRKLWAQGWNDRADDNMAKD